MSCEEEWAQPLFGGRGLLPPEDQRRHQAIAQWAKWVGLGVVDGRRWAETQWQSTLNRWLLALFRCTTP